MSTTLCTCFDISEEEIREAIRDRDLKDQDTTIRMTAAGSGCQGCKFEVLRILDEEREPKNSK